MQRLIFHILILSILFTDPIGILYAVYRGDASNTALYSSSVFIPLAGSSYVKGGKKGISKIDDMYGIIAKQADNEDGFNLFYKKIKDINPEEVHVVSVVEAIDPAIVAKRNANDFKKIINKDFINAKLGNSLAKKIKDLELENIEGVFKGLDKGTQNKLLEDLKDFSHSDLLEIENNIGLLDQYKEMSKLSEIERKSKMPEWIQKIRQGVRFNRERAAFYPYNEV